MKIGLYLKYLKLRRAKSVPFLGSPVSRKRQEIRPKLGPTVND